MRKALLRVDSVEAHLNERRRRTPRMSATTASEKENDVEALQAVMAAIQTGTAKDVRQASTAFAAGASTVKEVRDGDGRRCVHVAAARGDVEVIKCLVCELGCETDARDEEGFTALMTAASMGNLDAVKCFIELGADAKALTKSGAGAMHQIVMGAHQSGIGRDAEKCAEALRTLTSGKYGLTIEEAIEQRCESVGTPLLVAAMRGCSGMLETLISHGAKSSVSLPGGVTALALACASGDLKSVQVLISAGADVNDGPEGNMTALHIAAAHPSTESCSANMVKVLLDAGADADKADSGGMKAIHAAAATKRRAVVDALLPITKPDDADAGEWTTDGVISSVAAKLQAMQRDVGGKPGSASTSERFAVKDKAAAEKTKRAGNEAFVAGKFDEAEARYTESLEQDGSCAKTWANRAAARLKLKKFSQARDDARASRTLDPLFIKAWYREGEAALEMEEYEDSALAFFEGLQVDGDNPDLKRMFDEAISRGRAAHSAK